jgi:SAM-dependent methyltransferase
MSEGVVKRWLRRRFPHRVSPTSPAVAIRGRQGTTTFRYSTGDPSDYVFTVDIYGFRDHRHPDRHVGWWRFELPRGTGTAELHLDFDPLSPESATISANGTTLALVDSWHNPDFCFDPLGELKLVVRDSEGQIRRIETTLLKFFDRDVLRDFYDRQYANEGYSAPVDHPFLWELHDYKKTRLRRLFEKHIPSGGVALDVGCGRSLFSEIDVNFPFTVVSGDLEYVGVKTRASQVPEQHWLVFDGDRLPFADEQFDAVFAGEIIEHMPDVPATLAEWHRVLKSGGVVIITTPNRERFVSVADRRLRPYSEDHLSELSYRELAGPVLREAGFEFIEQSCLHLELWLTNVWNDDPTDDYLQSYGNKRRNVRVMKWFFALGRFFPWVSLGLVVVGRRR